MSLPNEPRGPEQGFLSVLMGDGRPLLFAVAGSLVFAGGFAIFLAATGQLLPHDSAYLGMNSDQLCAVASCRIVDFMVHDRASFGGTLAGMGILYAWLVAFPLSRREPWAWWALAVSGAVGFLTFLGYLGYGYLDTWHGIGTLLLMPVFATGMYRTRAVMTGTSPSSLLRVGDWSSPRTRPMLGRLVLLGGALATLGGGLLILRVGLGDTFVAEDLTFMRLDARAIRAVSPHLVPLLAHDRVGFGGGVVTMGLTTAMCLWCSGFSRHLHQAVGLAGVVSLGAALTVHFAVGYTNPWHLAPPLVAAACLVIGLALQRRSG